MTISCNNVNDTSGLCGTMESTGAGLGVFLQYLGQALPGLLIVLALIGIVVAIGLGVAGVIKGAIHGSYSHK